MRTKLLKIGRSTCVRIPATLVKRMGFNDQKHVELELRADGVLLKKPHVARAGWAAAFRLMHRRGDDRLIDEAEAHVETDRDRADWTW